MSVIKSKRGDSPVQFVDTARDLEIHTIRQTTKIQKKYRKFNDMLIELSITVYNNVKMANSMYNDTKEKIARRTIYFDETLRSLYALISQIDIAKELSMGNITDYGWTHWMELINKELTLIKSLKLSDKKKAETL